MALLQDIDERYDHAFQELEDAMLFGDMEAPVYDEEVNIYDAIFAEAMDAFGAEMDDHHPGDGWELDVENEQEANEDVPRPMNIRFTIFGVDAFIEFRFSMPEIQHMVRALDMQQIYRTENGCVISGLEGLCLVLYRLAHPGRLTEAKKIFGRNESTLSNLFNVVLKDIYFSWKHLLLFDHVRLTPAFLEQMAAAVYRKTARGANSRRDIWAFMDGTHLRVCRPGEDQEELYSRYKRHHSLKYQAVVTPDGIIVHFGGPFSGRRHDQRMMTESKLRDYLAQHSRRANGEMLFIYGDEGYQRLDPVHAPYRHLRLTPEEVWVNGDMQRPRLCVEWAFGYLSNHWSFVNLYQKLRIGLMPVGIYFPVIALFSNL